MPVDYSYSHFFKSNNADAYASALLSPKISAEGKSEGIVHSKNKKGSI